MKRWLIFALMALAAVAAQAQVEQAERGGLPPISVGASFSSFAPDYGLNRLYGFGAYLDVTPYHLGPVTAGLEGEWKILNMNQHANVHERSLSVGPIFSVRAPAHIRPFGKVMYGLGNFYYPYAGTRPSFYTDSYGIFVFGGGAEYRLNSRISIRGEYESQKWTHFRGAHSLTPNGVSVGVTYRISRHLF